jgi:hypothetical protein
VDGVTYETFKEAAVARNLIADDSGWRRTLTEAATFRMPVELRRLFSSILLHGAPQNAQQLFQEFEFHLKEDFMHRHGNDNVALHLTLKNLNELLNSGGKSNQDYGLPQPDMDVIQEILNQERQPGDEINQEESRIQGEIMVGQLNLPKKCF